MENEQAQVVDPTEGEKLVAPGVHVMLGGARVRIVVDNRAVVALEARWGSLMALAGELEKGAEGRMYTAITDILAASARGVPPGLDVVDLMDLSRMQEYADAVMVAFKQAGLWSDSPNGGGPARTGRSAGVGSTTPRSSPSGSTRRRSGR